jgi:hypothetical protein
MFNCFVGAINKSSEFNNREIIKNIFIRSANNLNWLKNGDTVLLKIALNSPDPYPATTDPLTVSVIAEELQNRGARMIIGDQSGIGHILHTPDGVIYGSSRVNFQKAGIENGGKMQFVGFEEGGWDNGFYKYNSETCKSWMNGFYETNWVKKADHIINLPRISTHTQAGVTLGFKNLVGLLREDSRMEFHDNGPFRQFMRKKFKTAKNHNNRDSELFFKKITEISLSIKTKLRLTFFNATKAQLTFGPDVLTAGFLPSYVANPDIGLVFGSSDPVIAEIMAMVTLIYLYRKSPYIVELNQAILHLINPFILKPGTIKIRTHPFISHAIKIGLGSTNIQPEYFNLQPELISELNGIVKKNL